MKCPHCGKKIWPRKVDWDKEIRKRIKILRKLLSMKEKQP